MEALGALGFVLLLAHGAAHVALCAAIVRAEGRQRRVLRGALALLLPPLTVVWAWGALAKRRVIAYGATLVAFALVVALIGVLG